MPPCRIKPPSISFSILHRYWPSPDVSGEGVRKSGSSQNHPSPCRCFLSSASLPYFSAVQTGLRWPLCSRLQDRLCLLEGFFIFYFLFFFFEVLFITVATGRKCCICGWRRRSQCDPRHPAKRHRGRGGDGGLPALGWAALSWGHRSVPASRPAARTQP